MAKCDVCRGEMYKAESLALGRCENCRAYDLKPSDVEIEGVGKDAPTVTNEQGGKQSHSPYRADLLPPHALLAVAKVLSEGAAKYGANNWHAIPAADNLNHAMVHILAHTAGDVSDEHLEHAATRILFALDQVRSGREAKLSAATAQSPMAVAPKFRKGESVMVHDTMPGVVCEDYTGGKFVRVKLDGDGFNIGYYPHSVAKMTTDAGKGGAA